MKPSCLNLDAKQTNVLKKFVKSLNKHKLAELYEETCSMDGPVFHCYSSGLGDVIYVEILGRICHLEYDDDGRIIGEVNYA